MEGKIPLRSATAKPTVISFSSQELCWLDDFSQAPKEVHAKLAWRVYMRMYVRDSVADKDAVVDAIIQTIQTTIKEHPATAWIVRNGHTLAHSLDRLPDSGASDGFTWTDQLANRIVELIMQVGNIGNNPAFHNLLDYRALTWKNPSKLAIKCLNDLATNLPLLYFLTWHHPNNHLADGLLNKWTDGVANVINKLPIRINDLVAILYITDNKNGDAFATMTTEWPEAVLLDQDALHAELWRRVLLSKNPAILERFEAYGPSQSYFRISFQMETLKTQASHNLRKHLPSAKQTLPGIRITEKRQLSIRELLHAAAAEAQAHLEKKGEGDEKKKPEPDHRFQFIPPNIIAGSDVLEEFKPEDIPPQYAQLQKDLAEGGINVRLVKFKNCPCVGCRAKSTPPPPTGSANPEASKAKDEPASPLKHTTSSSSSVSEDESTFSEEPDLDALAASVIAVATEQAKK